MKITEVAHRHKSVELEKIEIKTGGKLNLKIFAYPIKTAAYHKRLAFVVFYEYQTANGVYKNIDETSNVQPRFWINNDQDIRELAKNGKLILVSPTYQELRSKIIQGAVFNSANDYSKKQSKDNIDWFNEHRNDFSKREIRANDFARDKERAKSFNQTRVQNLPVFIPETIDETPYNQVKVSVAENIIQTVTDQEAVNKIPAPKNLNAVKVLQLKGRSSGLRRLLKKYAV